MTAKITARKAIEVMREQEWRDCTSCPLFANRSATRQMQALEFGDDLAEGERPHILFIAEGQSNDIWRMGWAGAEAGKPWLFLAAEAGVDMGKCLVTSEVLCPTVHAAEAGDFSMKDYFTRAAVEEIRACSNRVWHEIYLTQPRLIVTLGREALRSLADAKASKVFSYGVYEIYEATSPGPIHPFSVPVFVMPAAWEPHRERDTGPRGLWVKMLDGFRVAWSVAVAHAVGNRYADEVDGWTLLDEFRRSVTGAGRLNQEKEITHEA